MKDSDATLRQAGSYRYTLLELAQRGSEAVSFICHLSLLWSEAGPCMRLFCRLIDDFGTDQLSV